VQHTTSKKNKNTDIEVHRMLERGVSLAIFPSIMRVKTTKETWKTLQ